VSNDEQTALFMLDVSSLPLSDPFSDEMSKDKLFIVPFQKAITTTTTTAIIIIYSTNIMKPFRKKRLERVYPPIEKAKT
jgi:hypothetical protein